jgi:hypothetical protein
VPPEKALRLGLSDRGGARFPPKTSLKAAFFQEKWEKNAKKIGKFLWEGV